MTDPNLAAPRKSPEAERAAASLKVILPIVGVLIAIGAAYGIARYQATAEMQKAVDEAEAARKQAAERGDSLEKKLEAAERKALLLEARQLLSQALLALDGRNFGIASKNLKSAAKLLSKTDDDQMRALAKKIEKFRLVATENLGEQRAEIVDWMKSFDEAVQH